MNFKYILGNEKLDFPPVEALVKDCLNFEFTVLPEYLDPGFKWEIG